jgi:anaerobic carbon-monoxide dehydrogenase iron sulfur subunit
MNERERKLLEIDPDLCTGCGLCMAACSLQHEGECSTSSSRVKVLIDEHKGMSMPVVCMQCQDAPCAEICPRRAITRDPRSGAYVVNPDLCIGCRLCVLVCPVGAICFDIRRARHALKCDLCDGDPRCAIFCPPHAITVIRPGRAGEAQRQHVFAKYLLVAENVKATQAAPAGSHGDTHAPAPSAPAPAGPPEVETKPDAEAPIQRQAKVKGEIPNQAQAQRRKPSAAYLRGAEERRS